jgi:hypothetical protein
VTPFLDEKVFGRNTGVGLLFSLAGAGLALVSKHRPTANSRSGSVDNDSSVPGLTRGLPFGSSSRARFSEASSVPVRFLFEGLS